MATTSKYISVHLHGSGVANCGSYPDIWASFTITFTRNPGETTVTWKVSGMSWSHPTSGKFGYKFRAYVDVNDTKDYFTIISKDNITATNWWNATTLYNPDYGNCKFTSTSNTTSVKIYVHGQNHADESCLNNGSPCYGSSQYKLVGTFSAAIPPYETSYTISYDANGGTGAPSPQSKSSVHELTLSSQIPVYSIPITYHNNPDTVVYVNRQFNNWLDDYGGVQTTYSPGGTFTQNRNTTLLAQWGDAPFSPIDLPDKYVTVTYNYNGGSGSPPSSVISRQELGYNTNPSSIVATYEVGNSYNTSTALDLYPIYSDAVLPYSSLPVPTREGFRFMGWYYDPEFEEPISSDIHTSFDITIYAKWIQLPMHQFTPDGDWGSVGPYVWRFNGTTWEKVAHVYQFDGTKWVDISQ